MKVIIAKYLKCISMGFNFSFWFYYTAKAGLITLPKSDEYSGVF